jgi:hypothetical protein
VGWEIFRKARNDKALNNQGFVGTNMAEAMYISYCFSSPSKLLADQYISMSLLPSRFQASFFSAA